MVWFGCIIMMALLWSSLAVQTKRWHDRNKSGWWNLIGFVPIVGPIWAFIELGFLQGTYGANRYDLRPAACPSYKHGLPISNTQEDTYIGEPQEEKEMVTQGSSVSNSWRNQ